MRLCLLTGGDINMLDDVHTAFGRAGWFEDGE
jgi:hypothetical protein